MDVELLSTSSLGYGHRVNQETQLEAEVTAEVELLLARLASEEALPDLLEAAHPEVAAALRRRDRGALVEAVKNSQKQKRAVSQVELDDSV